ncbi:hypothetical protein GGX14DRAFT_589198, partial [Mycena pura]
MPFTVKATYGRSGELRKLSFPSFPTYDQLYNQLYRVFPISHSYYFSKLLFSPDSSKTGTILIGREVHNADQYNSCTAPYASNLWANATLRFTVFDETPHKLPAGFVADNPWGATQPYIPFAHIPPPPIILSSFPGASGKQELDVSSASYAPSSTSTLKPQHQREPQSVTAGTPAACCAVGQGKLEIQDIVSRFKDDLDRILKDSGVGTPTPTPLLPPPVCAPFMPPPPPSSFCLFKYCTICAKIFQGPWYACETCSIVVCVACHDSQSDRNFCLASMTPHMMKKEVCAACPAEAQPSKAASSSWPTFLPPPFPPPPPTQWAPSQMWTPPQQGYCPIYPFGAPTPTPTTPHNHPPAPAPTATASLPADAQVPESPAPPAPPVIHRDVVCDMCDKVIEGVRHKCLDCPDYDLCTPCIASGSAERHNPFHEFLEIKEPGRVIVHTVYSGDERDATRAPVQPPQTDEQPAAHYATCNLCDSRIRGDRYKCADCPDFDTCSDCFSITPEQHPLHAFVKLSKASDYIRREIPVAPMHAVTCDGCLKTICGIRYKACCMHPECPDFDLCESCEAFPIPMHPDMHPMLKMRSPSSIVPTVYRVGQTTLIDREEIQRGRSPAPVPSPRPRSRSPSFERGYMVNPSSRSNTMPASFFDSAPSPPPQSSPFFFRSESSRSSSPVLAYQPPVSPPYVPRPPSPMMMPGGLYDEPAFARQPQPTFGYRYSSMQPTVSRFSHSPSPSPPLFRDRSQSPTSPIPPLRHATWAPAFLPQPSEELRHLMQQHYHDVPDLAFSRLTVQDEEAAVMDSPLTGEALLSHPVEMSQTGRGPITSFNHSLAALLNGYESENEVAQVPDLRAAFLDDVTLPDGQNFPPGAEFMKCWRVVNSGDVEWPAGTELVWVAGEKFARGHTGPGSVSIGMVKAGAEVDLWTGELKAPEVAGRFVSYWRLRDAEGNLFGDNIWIDINVTETRSNEQSLSSSSIIMMPRGAQSAQASSAQGASASQASRGEVEEDDVSSDSDASSVSLISMPTSEDEDWAEVPSEEPQAQRYVVLYDEASS